MKSFGLAVVALLVPAASFAADDWREKAIALIREEPKVIEAMFPQPISLWVSARDDGSNRDGYADYVCLLLSEAGMPQGEHITIRILDAAALSNDQMTELGRGQCSKG